MQFIAPVRGADSSGNIWQNLKDGDSWLIPADTGPNIGGVVINDGGLFLHGASQNNVSITWQMYWDQACARPIPGVHGAPTGQKFAKGMYFVGTTDPNEIRAEKAKFGEPFSTFVPTNARIWMLVKPYPGQLSGDDVAVVSCGYNQPKGPR